MQGEAVSIHFHKCLFPPNHSDLLSCLILCVCAFVSVSVAVYVCVLITYPALLTPVPLSSSGFSFSPLALCFSNVLLFSHVNWHDQDTSLLRFLALLVPYGGKLVFEETNLQVKLALIHCSEDGRIQGPWSHQWGLHAAWERVGREHRWDPLWEWALVHAEMGRGGGGGWCQWCCSALCRATFTGLSQSVRTNPLPTLTRKTIPANGHTS